MHSRWGAATAAPPAPVCGAKTQKRRYLDRLKAMEVSDVFVVGGATAVGYLCVMLSEICANRLRPRRSLSLACQR